MRAGRNQNIAAPGDWLVALRGLRDNPIRGYLLAQQRRRKLHFWLRPDLVYFTAVAGLVAMLGLFIIDLLSSAQAGGRLSQVYERLVLTYQYSSWWLVGLPLLAWWMQGLFLWVYDALSLFSYDRTHGQALPVEFAVIPECDTALITGALSVLLPPVVLRALVTIAACYVLIPWPMLGTVYDYNPTYYWPALSRYLTLYLPVGVVALSLSAALCAVALSCMLLTASHRGLAPVVRIACAYTLPLVQIVGTYVVNAMHWNHEAEDLASFPQVLRQLAVFVPLTTLALASGLLLLALAHSRAKTTLAITTALLPLLAGMATLLVLRGISDESTMIPCAWAAGCYVLVNPLSAPDPTCVLANAKWCYIGYNMLNDELGADPAGEYAASLAPDQQPRRPLAWLWASVVQFVILLLVTAISLEAARLSVAHWRQAG